MDVEYDVYVKPPPEKVKRVRIKIVKTVRGKPVIDADRPQKEREG